MPITLHTTAGIIQKHTAADIYQRSICLNLGYENDD